MNRQAFIENPAPEIQEKLLLAIEDSQAPLVIFDIGACEGESSIRYARLFPNAQLYAFEPLPSNMERVQQLLRQYQVTTVSPQALCLSDKTGETQFYVSSGKPEHAADADWDYGNKSSSILPPAKTKELHSWLKFEEAISVPTTTLRQFCAEKNIARIDFIHMDVQGAELMVLQGAGDFIQHINMIWLEVEAVELYKGQPLKKDVEDFMQQRGFVKLEDTVYTTAGDQFWARREYILRKKGKTFLLWRKGFTFFKFYYKKIRRNLLK